MFNLLYGKIVSAIKKAANSTGQKLVRLTVKNVFGYGNQLTEIDVINPYGVGNIPPSNVNVFLTSVGNSEKCLYSLGSVTSVPNITREPTQGESWSFSQKYVLVYQNDGLKAYRQSENPDFYCTLPNGQAFVQMMLNRIVELENIINSINSNYTTLKSAFDSHRHSGIQPGGSNSGTSTVPLSQTALIPSSNLTKDQTYLSSGKALIDDLGEVYS